LHEHSLLLERKEAQTAVLLHHVKETLISSSRGHCLCLIILAWYDYDLRGYQVDRQESELDRIFEERVSTNLSVVHHAEKSTGEHLATKVIREPETEWQQVVKRKKNDEYYNQYKQVRPDHHGYKDSPELVGYFIHPSAAIYKMTSCGLRDVLTVDSWRMTRFSKKRGCVATEYSTQFPGNSLR
jgi:hypothetical protein